MAVGVSASADANFGPQVLVWGRGPAVELRSMTAFGCETAPRRADIYPLIQACDVLQSWVTLKKALRTHLPGLFGAQSDHTMQGFFWGLILSP